MQTETTNGILPKDIESKLDEQLQELKDLVLNNYKSSTADEMELNLFFKLQELGKTSMQGYMEKKTMN